MSHVRTQVSGEIVKETLDKIVNAVEDTPLDAVMMACLSFCFLAQSPDITSAQLVEGVGKASTFIANHLEMLTPAASSQVH